MKIFYQYSNNKTLSPTKGDMINEIGTLRALSQFADVYYSGQKFDCNHPSYGLKNYSCSILSMMMKQKYDVYFVRNNVGLFKKIPKKVKKIWFATPYDRYCFTYADIIATTTRTWAEWLRDGIKMHALNPRGYKFNAFPIYQTITNFSNMKGHAITNQIRDEQYNGGFIIGSFGRKSPTDHATTLISSMTGLVQSHSDIKLAISITNSNGKLRGNNIINCKYKHKYMPYVYSACDLIVVSYHGASWNFTGSLKTIEAASCGIPVILGRSPAREELFGKDYKLFLDRFVFRNVDSQSIKELSDMILYVYENPSIMNDISKDLIEKSKFYSIDESSKRLKIIFEELLK